MMKMEGWILGLKKIISFDLHTPVFSEWGALY